MDGEVVYTLYIWHALPYLIIFSLTGGEDVSLAKQLIRTPVLIASAFAVSLPVYYLVEMRVLKMKLRFSSEKETLDLTTGKMVQVSVDGKVRTGRCRARDAPRAHRARWPGEQRPCTGQAGRPAVAPRLRRLRTGRPAHFPWRSRRHVAQLTERGIHASAATHEHAA